MRSKAWGPNSIGLVSLEEEEETPGVGVHRDEAMGEHSEKAAVCKPRREASPETNPAGTLILDSQPP